MSMRGCPVTGHLCSVCTDGCKFEEEENDQWIDPTQIDYDEEHLFDILDD